MKQSWIKILLMLSLAMNAGIMGTLLVGWLRPDKAIVFRDRNQYSKDRFAYNEPALRHQYQEAVAKNRAKLELSRQARRNFVSSLAEENFDAQKSRQLMKKFLAARTEMESSLGENLIRFRSEIKDPKQVEAFNQWIQARNSRLEQLSQADSLAPDSTSLIRERLKARIKQRMIQRRTGGRNRFGQ